MGKTLTLGTTDGTGYGMQLYMFGDVGLGAETETFFMVNNNENQVATNPRFFLELGGHSRFTLYTPITQISLWLNSIPYKFVPLDF